VPTCALSYVGSVEVVMMRSECSRTIEMIHTLRQGQPHKQTHSSISTHTPPKANTAMRSHFCLFANLSLFTMGIGSTMIIRSVTMLIAAFANQDACSLIHVPGVADFQNRLTGVQTKRQAATVAIVYPTMIAMKIQHHIWNRRVVKTR